MPGSTSIHEVYTQIINPSHCLSTSPTMKNVESGDMDSIPVIPLIIILQDRYGISLVKDTQQAIQGRPRPLTIPTSEGSRSRYWSPRGGTLTACVWRKSSWTGRIWYLEELQQGAVKTYTAVATEGLGHRVRGALAGWIACDKGDRTSSTAQIVRWASWRNRGMDQ